MRGIQIRAVVVFLDISAIIVIKIAVDALTDSVTKMAASVTETVSQVFTVKNVTQLVMIDAQSAISRLVPVNYVTRALMEQFANQTVVRTAIRPERG